MSFIIMLIITTFIYVVSISLVEDLRGDLFFWGWVAGSLASIINYSIDRMFQ